MDAIFMSSAADQKSVYPNKIKNNNIPWRTNSCGAANFVSNIPNENLLPHTRFIHGRGSSSDHLLFGPPFTYHPLLNPFMYQNHQQQQPPLLPLPVPNKQPLHSSVPYRTRSLSSSSPPSNLKSNRNKDQSLTPPKRSKSKTLKPTTTEATKSQAVNKPSVKMMPSSAAKALGPHPVAEDFDRLSSSIFTLSPPPSSLPLPSFSLRPKLSCNAQAASVHVDGASTDVDNLRRLLRLPLN